VDKIQCAVAKKVTERQSQCRELYQPHFASLTSLQMSQLGGSIDFFQERVSWLGNLSLKFVLSFQTRLMDQGHHIPTLRYECSGRKCCKGPAREILDANLFEYSPRMLILCGYEVAKIGRRSRISIAILILPELPTS
jgi:hypothetical protein